MIETMGTESQLKGPPTLPVLGNLHQFPKNNFHLGFARLAEECKSLETRIGSIMLNCDQTALLSA